jgi:hypothetical protein
MPPARTGAEQETLDAAKRGAAVALSLVVAGAALGLVWQAWSPPGPLAAVQSGGIQADETEAWAAADGRFALIVGALGLLAGVLTWTARRARGPFAVWALTVGGLGGAAVTDLIGYLVRGPGKSYPCGSETGKCIEHLPLSVHMHALLLLEPLVAVLVYGLLAAFTARDDLGRADPVRERLSVRAADYPQYGWGYGDGAGAPQQGDLPTQQAHQPGEPQLGRRFGE